MRGKKYLAVRSSGKKYLAVRSSGKKYLAVLFTAPREKGVGRSSNGQ